MLSKVFRPIKSFKENIGPTGNSGYLLRISPTTVPRRKTERRSPPPPTRPDQNEMFGSRMYYHYSLESSSINQPTKSINQWINQQIKKYNQATELYLFGPEKQQLKPGEELRNKVIA